MINLQHLKLTGELLGNRYQLKKKIGGGGFAEVWKAYDTLVQMDVALKIYTSANNISDEDVELFRTGFARIADLNHPNILSPKYFDVTDGNPWLAMTLCENGAASALCGKISEDELWNFAKQVASGLEHIHEHGIIHNDIKPANVLIDSNNNYRITDFDISTKWRNTVRPNNNENGGSGTPEYMSNERYNHGDTPALPCFASDIWALGASLFELATGDTPYGQYGGLTQTPTDDIRNRITRDFSPEMKRLIQLCLSFETWNRPSAKEVVEMVESRNIPQIKSKARKRNWMKAAAIVLPIAVIGSSAYLGSKGLTKKWLPWETDSTIVWTKLDSAYLAQIEESRIMVSEAVLQIDINNEENLNVQPMLLAIDKYHHISRQGVSQNALDKGKNEWAISLKQINDVCDSLKEKERAYREDYGVEDLAMLYLSRYDSITSYVKYLN